MYVTNLRLSDFRSYESARLDLAPGATLFLGPNGQGKTNLVEAVEYIATLGSHRVASDQPLVRHGQPQATLEARIRAGLNDERTLTVDLEINLGAPNRARLNKGPVRPRDVVGALRVVVFAPEDLALAKGDPADRRAFLDALVATRWPRLAGVRADYERVLRQRTTLLKALSGRSLRSAGADAEATLAVWDERLVALGAEIIVARLATVRDLGGPYAERYGAIAPVGHQAVVTYESKAEPAWASGDGPTDPAGIAERLWAAIERRRGDELQRGQSLVGPHRDDLGLALGTLPVKGYASHGEAWSVALGLRLASLDVLRGDGIEPVLILDDVFAELDAARRARLAALVGTAEQVLLTAAVAADVPQELDVETFNVGLGWVARAAGGVESVVGGEDGVPVGADVDEVADVTAFVDTSEVVS
jgi:DNA replication and repair protein RecF